MRISVVFVRFGLPEMENRALACACAGARTRDVAYRVVDNWGNPETLTALWSRVLIEESCAASDLAVMLNSDCFLPTGWDAALVSAFVAHPDLGAAGPSANQGQDQEVPPGDIGQPVHDAAGWPTQESVDRCATRCREVYGARVDDGDPYGFCYAIRVQATREIGFFDAEVRDGYTLYGSEQAFSRRLRAAGWRVGIVRGAYAYHLGGRSGQEGERRGVVDIATERRRGRELFFGPSK